MTYQESNSVSLPITFVEDTLPPSPPPSPNPTIWGRTPALGNSKIVQVYLRRVRDKLISKKMHIKLHPLV